MSLCYSDWMVILDLMDKGYDLQHKLDKKKETEIKQKNFIEARKRVKNIIKNFR